MFITAQVIMYLVVAQERVIPIVPIGRLPRSGNADKLSFRARITLVDELLGGAYTAGGAVRWSIDSRRSCKVEHRQPEELLGGA